MSFHGDLSPDVVKLVEDLESKLNEQGTNAFLLAYSNRARLSPSILEVLGYPQFAELSQEALDLIQELEKTIQAQGYEIVIIAHESTEE